MKPYLPALACALISTLVACGHDDHGSAVDEACEHMANGPSSAITAVDDPSADAPDVTASHRRFDVTLLATGNAGEWAGYVDVVSAEAGDLLLFLDPDVSVKLWDDQGSEVSAESSGSVGECDEVAVSHTFEVQVGTYSLQIGPADAEVVRIVAERADHDH